MLLTLLYLELRIGRKWEANCLILNVPTTKNRPESQKRHVLDSWIISPGLHTATIRRDTLSSVFCIHVPRTVGLLQPVWRYVQDNGAMSPLRHRTIRAEATLYIIVTL